MRHRTTQVVAAVGIVRGVHLCAFLALLLMAILLQAQGLSSLSLAANAELRSNATAARNISRADLAAAYLRLEQAYFAASLPTDEIARINREFDRATQAFFIGSRAEAIRLIDGLTASLPSKPLSQSQQLLASLKVAADPKVWPAHEALQASVSVYSMYECPGDIKGLTLHVVDATGKSLCRAPLETSPGASRAIDVRIPFELAEGQLAPGLHRLELASADGHRLVVGRVNAIEGLPLAAQGRANEERLTLLEPAPAQLSNAIANCRARNRLLSDNPSEESSIQFLSDLDSLAKEVASEVEQLERGLDPYRGRPGDHWGMLMVDGRQVPLRIYAPKTAATGSNAPLLVVLHGMGGDENMFFEGYGAGVVKRIAEQKGLLVASPQLYSFGSDTSALDELIGLLSQRYSIDRDRVYVLGHSMGAVAAEKLARGHNDGVAGACCIAGGSFRAAAGTPPILVVSPELDGVVPAARLQASAEEALAGGMPGELRKMPGYGHTLAVGVILPEAVDWLLQHRRHDSGTKGAASDTGDAN